MIPRFCSYDMQEIFRIGLISRPQGIRGEVKVMPLTDDPSRFLKLKETIIDGEKYKIISARLAGDAVIVGLYGIADRNAAENLRGKYLCVRREDAVPLARDSYYIADIIGCKVITDTGKTVGNVTEVTSAHTDVFTLDCGGGSVARFPFLKDALVSVDIEDKTITVKETRFSEIVCYED